MLSLFIPLHIGFFMKNLIYRVLFLVTTLFLGQIFAHAPDDSSNSINNHFDVIMISPLYRNAIYPTMQDPNHILIKTRIVDNSLLNHEINVSLRHNNIVLKSWQFSNLEAKMTLDLSVSDISFENTRSSPYSKDDTPYVFTFTYLSSNSILEEEELNLNKYPKAPEGINEVRFDDEGNLLINGKKRFIFASYLLNYSNENYNYLSSIGIDGFVENGFRVGLHRPDTFGIFRTDRNGIADVTRARQEIVAIRAIPNLLMYRLLDEPNGGGGNTKPEDINFTKMHYQAAFEEDPYHPAIVPLSIFNHAEYSASMSNFSYIADVFGIDSYPIFKDNRVDGTYILNGNPMYLPRDIGALSLNHTYISDSSLGKSAWIHEVVPRFAVLQLFEAEHWMMPRNNQIKNMAFQHLIAGVKGFISYSYNSNDMLPYEYYAQTLRTEVESILPVIHSTRVNKEVNITSTDDTRLKWSYRILGQYEYIILANTSSIWNAAVNSSNQILTITITFPSGGEQSVQAIIKDMTMPQSYQLSQNKITIALDGVNNTSSGILVLKRKR